MTEHLLYLDLRCAFIMTNVVLTVKLDGRIQEESLLHASQRREAAMQMRNIRLMCSGGGRLVCSITDLNRELTRRMLAVRLSRIVLSISRSVTSCA